MNIAEQQAIARKEIMEKRKEVISDTLNFSVGEIINLYKDDEIDLEPAFQRFFRWSRTQQTKFIESLILGYPVPSIFVFQKDDGIWEVIDGVQRISSILNFVGLLSIDEKGKFHEFPLILESGDILENLENKCYDEISYKIIEENKDQLKGKIDMNVVCPLDKATIIDLKRSRIPVIVLSNKSIGSSRLELFKRLNSGGSHLEPQEIRNALIYMSDSEVFEIIKEFSKNENFRELIRLDENGEKLSFDMEVLTRYLIMANLSSIPKFNSKQNAEDFFDTSIEYIIQNISKNIIEKQLEFFIKVVNIIAENLCSDYGFRIYQKSKQTFRGAFSWFVFEIVIYGALKNQSDLQIEKFINAIKMLELDNIQGKKTLDRMTEISRRKAEEVFNLAKY